MLIALAPIILPIPLIGIAKVFIESFATWRNTGRWPRNEGFQCKRAAALCRASKPLSPTFA